MKMLFSLGGQWSIGGINYNNQTKFSIVIGDALIEHLQDCHWKEWWDSLWIMAVLWTVHVIYILLGSYATVTVFNINLTDDFLFPKLIVDLINQYEDFVC